MMGRGPNISLPFVLSRQTDGEKQNSLATFFQPSPASFILLSHSLLELIVPAPPVPLSEEITVATEAIMSTNTGHAR